MINRSHLREVSSRWQGSTVDGKTDISPEDAKIVDILLDFLVEREDYELVQVLSEWKKVSDDKFLRQLVNFTNYESIEIDHESTPSREKSGDLDYSYKPIFLHIWGMMIPVDSIHFVEVGSEWDSSKNRMGFYLEINPRKRVSSRPNVKKVFLVEEQRDDELQVLKDRLVDYGATFI